MRQRRTCASLGRSAWRPLARCRRRCCRGRASRHRGSRFASLAVRFVCSSWRSGRSGREVGDQLTSRRSRSLEITEGAWGLVVVGSCNRREPASAPCKEWTMDSGCWRLARAKGRVRFILCNGIPSATRGTQVWATTSSKSKVRAVGMCRKSALSGSSSVKRWIPGSNR